MIVNNTDFCAAHPLIFFVILSENCLPIEDGNTYRVVTKLRPCISVYLFNSRLKKQKNNKSTKLQPPTPPKKNQRTQP